jgi:cysteinyl-tRNA synthetase
MSIHRTRFFATVAVLILLGCLNASMPAYATHAARAQTSGSAAPASGATKPAPNFRNWVSYYGYVGTTGDQTMQSLARFDLIDVDLESGAGNFTNATQAVAWWHQQGNVVLSYLNVGACETFRSYWSQCKQYVLGPYQGYPGEYWMNVTDPGYQNLIVNTVAPELAATGADGFYLDNLDIYQQQFKGITTGQLKQGIATILDGLRQEYPNLLLVAQNGVYSPTDNVLFYTDPNTGEQVYQYVDGESHEDVNSYPPPQRAVVYSTLEQLRSDGRFIFLLDYPPNLATAQVDFQRTICHNFLPYDSTLSLNQIFFLDKDPPQAPTGLTAQVVNGQVQLAWNAVPSCTQPWGDDFGVSSYRVYRDGAPITQTYLTNPAVPLLSYTDTSVQSGHTYTYTVTGVDTGLHESPPSAPVTIKVP